MKAVKKNDVLLVMKNRDLYIWFLYFKFNYSAQQKLKAPISSKTVCRYQRPDHCVLDFVVTTVIFSLGRQNGIT